uniref:DDE-1 domain-containing protein n=1 Tax=Anopheles arabiensis TaxID=7173 RepID=A0A182I8H3_ANOAR
ISRQWKKGKAGGQNLCYLLKKNRNLQIGRKWLRNYMKRNVTKRNPGFSFRTPELLPSASSRVSENDIRGWFQMITSWLTKNGLHEILDDPSRVFNADETSFFLHPKSKEVIARIGSRNVYEAEQAADEQNITVMLHGSIINPHVILPGKRLRQDLVQSFPEEWGIGQSERGWMDTPNFLGYIEKIFHPFLVRKNATFPVILFVDGHASHIGLNVADLCQSLGIILICLYPNHTHITHITQPADVSKQAKSVESWKFNNPGSILNTLHFASVLSMAIENGIKSSTIKNGFRACGLHPFDSNAIDYSKCIATSATGSLITNETTDVFVTPEAFEESIQKESDTTQHGSVDQSVTISMDRIVEAYDIISELKL